MDSATQMVIDGQRAFAMVGAIMWTMLRTGALLTAMPLIGTRAVPGRVRVMLAGTLAMVLAPILPPVPEWDGFTAQAVLSIARELAVGASMGFMLKLIFEAGALAGELVSQSTGLSFAQMSDPMRGVTSGVIAQWFYLGFGLLFFAANGHLAVIALLVDSYKALPIGTALPDAGAFAEVAPTLFLQILRGGLTLALPMMVAML
ncbi:flagellar biosynthetic protein FliR, partial [Xanthomonas perforans]